MMHHICVQEKYLTVDGVMVPFGRVIIEEELTRILGDILDEVLPCIGEGDVFVCGADPARRMLGRKLEDRLGRPVIYE